MAAASTAARRPTRRTGGGTSRRVPQGIRWDRLSRYALLLVFVVLVLLYIGPARSYISTLGESHERQAQVRKLEAEHARLEARRRALADPAVVESVARRLLMLRPGERGFVMRNLPRGR